MKQPKHIWLLYGGCLAVMLAAIVSISVRVLELEEAQYHAAVRSLVEENARLSLWRMDSVVTPILGRENARPFDAYTALVQSDPKSGEGTDYVLTYFQFEEQGQNLRPFNTYTKSLDMRDVIRCLDRFAALERQNGRTTLENILMARSRDRNSRPQTEQPLAEVHQQLTITTTTTITPPPAQQRSKSYAEYRQRAEVSNRAVVQSKLATNVDQFPTQLMKISEGMLVPYVQTDRLLLIRRVVVNGRKYVQGCDVDVLKLQRMLRKEVEDLLPNAKLMLVRDVTTADQSRLMATLPFQLIAGPAPVPRMRLITPLRLSLVATWTGALGVAIAAGVLMHGLVVLAERRGAFVSAVTHELRTPLTTFRIYTEMLSEDMVHDPDKQRKYLQVLSTEADRLTHLVENVLAYAKLQRDDKAISPQPTTLGTLVERVNERLSRRAEQANMMLVNELSEEDAKAMVLADPVGVEQVLYNLVDNACKYAAGADDKRIHLFARNKTLAATSALCIRDHGPGIHSAMAKRVFRPFAKSAHVAADTAPGVGLGLALSRRYAQAMNATIDFDTPEDGEGGVCFELRLKRVSEV